MSYRSPYDNYGHAMLTANALRTPQKAALVYRGRSYTFDALNRSVNKLANALAAAGVKPGQRVGSLLSEAISIARLYPAEAKLGAVIAAYNPYWDEEQVVRTTELSKLDAFVFDRANAATIAKVRARLPGIKLWLSIGGPQEGAVDLDQLV
ncbi:MAG TPA: AMP-binding protein, partial [Alphaproteobacteria bacterium]|nr:AMP-binding protein [Alphaproteobacteria bacterium]